MKTTMLFLLMFCWLNASSADNTRYAETMIKNIDLIYKSQSIEDLQQTVNVFDRIGNTEKDKWEPFYYASFGYIMMATRETDPIKKDSYLDQAKIQLDKAMALKPEDSEIVTLEGFISMIRVSVDPASRGQKYSGQAIQMFSKASALNPNNPRALALMAQMQFGMARFFKSAPTEACATTRAALEKFESFKPLDKLAPVWGKSMTEGLLNQCQ